MEDICSICPNLEAFRGIADIKEVLMTFDKWLLEVHNLTWEQYLGLTEEEQDELSDEYEKSTSNW